MLGKLPVPGRPTNLDYSRARANCARSRCGWGFLDIFFLIYHLSSLFPYLWETARYRLKYRPKGPLSLKQPTNIPNKGAITITSFSTDIICDLGIEPTMLKHTPVPHIVIFNISIKLYQNWSIKNVLEP